MNAPTFSAVATRSETALAAALTALCSSIAPLDVEAMDAARNRQQVLTKPQGSLGRLEALSVQIAGITGKARPRLCHKVALVMAGDHGVVAEGVSAYPQAVTAQMVANFLAGGAAINVLARQIGARVVVVDMGVAADLPAHPTLIDAKVRPGTRNMAVGPALSRAEAMEAMLRGAAIVEQQIADGLDILATGEMGIGNTTAASAIACALTRRDPAEVAGRGAGLDDAGVAHKIAVLRRVLATNRPNSAGALPPDALDVLAKVGGLEIAGLAGAMLAAASHRRPVVVDGVIATAAAMIAVTLAPALKPYLIAGHHSAERGHTLMLDWLGLEPLLDLHMRLGEGSGALLGMALADAACRLLDEMATFGEAGVSGRAAG